MANSKDQQPRSPVATAEWLLGNVLPGSGQACVQITCWFLRRMMSGERKNDLGLKSVRNFAVVGLQVEAAASPKRRRNLHGHSNRDIGIIGTRPNRDPRCSIGEVERPAVARVQSWKDTSLGFPAMYRSHESMDRLQAGGEL